MAELLDLNAGDVIDNARLCEIFNCSTQGGVRRARKTGTLVIVSNYVESLYQDKWINDLLHYTGMGRVGDQNLDGAQNKTLAESDSNGVEVHLFEVYENARYTYQGRVRLAAEPYQEQQSDVEGDLRSVWMFPLTLTNGQRRPVERARVESNTAKRQRAARRLSDEEVAMRAASAKAQPGKLMTTSTIFTRNENVSELAKRRAKGICQLCDKPAPFAGKTGEPYLETHHIVWLSKGGNDNPANTVALCPNCHRKMHVVNAREDVQRLEEVLSNFLD